MMKKRIGILTSGGDCPGLNAAIRGVAKAAYGLFDAQIVGIRDGYRGLLEGEWQEMKREDFSGILTLGGTILGSSRQPFKQMRGGGDDHADRVAAMKKNFEKMKLDCLVVLGGNGTHKSIHLLSGEGVPVIGLPKTIDNDLWGTDVCFGFHTAVDIATEVLDRVHTTASSHGRTMVVELMGNKAGWLTLYAGIAGGADVVLIPEIPYEIDEVVAAVERRARSGKEFSIIAVAEGAVSAQENRMSKKEFNASRQAMPFSTVSYRIADQISQATGLETRVVVPGYIQRGGSPSAYDRVLSTLFGVHAAELIRDERYGRSVALAGATVTSNPIGDVAGRLRQVPADHQMIDAGRRLGVSFGD